MNQFARINAATAAQVRRPMARVVEVPVWGATSSIDPMAIRRLIRARRLRAEFLNPALLGEPGWDLLLEAFACGLAQQRVTVSGLIDTAEVPSTTGLRWVRALVEQGLLLRRKDKIDGRKVFVEVTDFGMRALGAYFTSLPPHVHPL